MGKDKTTTTTTKTLEDDFHSEQLKHQSAKPSR